MRSLCRAMELLSSSQTCKLTHWSRPGVRTCSSTSPTTRSVALATRRATVLQQGISMWVFLFHPSAAIPHISYHGIEFFCIAQKFKWNVGTICLILDWRLILSLTVHPAITVTSFKGILKYSSLYKFYSVLCHHKTWLYYKKYPRKSNTLFFVAKLGLFEKVIMDGLQIINFG